MGAGESEVRGGTGFQNLRDQATSKGHNSPAWYLNPTIHGHKIQAQLDVREEILDGAFRFH